MAVRVRRACYAGYGVGDGDGDANLQLTDKQMQLFIQK